MELTPELRAAFWAKVTKTPDCWIFNAHAPASRYGIFYWGPKRWAAHRLSVLLDGRSIAAGLNVDHLCRVTRCVRPDHLEVVTARENIIRGVGASAQNARKTHCYKGHPFTDENTIVRNGFRFCRTCIKEKNHAQLLKRQARRRAEADYRGPPGLRTHCPRGHEYTEENTRIARGRDGQTQRVCRACDRLRPQRKVKNAGIVPEGSCHDRSDEPSVLQQSNGEDGAGLPSVREAAIS